MEAEINGLIVPELLINPETAEWSWHEARERLMRPDMRQSLWSQTELLEILDLFRTFPCISMSDILDRYPIEKEQSST